MNPQAPAPVPPQTATPPVIPAEWPGAFGIYKTARDATRINLWPIIGIALIGIVVSAITSRGFGYVGRLVGEIISVFLAAGSTLLYLASAKGQKLSIGGALSQGASLFLKYLLLSLLTGVALFVSLLLLVIPFFIVFPRVILAPYYLIDKKMGVVEAFKASWEGTKGHSLKVYGIVGVSILFGLLCIVLVGIYFLIMYSSVLAILYLHIQRQPSAQTVPAAAGAPVAPVAPQPEAPVSNPVPEQPADGQVPPATPQI